jgi:rfaE bifunctional protein kinase chain/domain
MTPDRFEAITSRYGALRIAVFGDFCLDRYLEIDPARAEMSIETGLAVHNVVRVRSQPGAAGTILANLVALGVGTLLPIGFAGEDGEGFELSRALGRLTNVKVDGFHQTPARNTFTYCKPLVVEAGQPPRELNRLDTKNWTPTPAAVEDRLLADLARVLPQLDALILMDQVEAPDSGALTRRVLAGIGKLIETRPDLLVIADSRRSLEHFPRVCFKMNHKELGLLLGGDGPRTIDEARRSAAELARRTGRSVFVTLAEDGLIAADANEATFHAPSLPVRGPIDIVGAGDSVTANLAASLAAGASLEEAIRIANLAASLVIHQLGTTGTASVRDMASLFPV